MRTTITAVVGILLTSGSIATAADAQLGGGLGRIKAEKRYQQRLAKGKTCKTKDGKFIRCPDTQTGHYRAKKPADQTPPVDQAAGDQTATAPDGD